MSDAFRRAMRDLGATAPAPPDGLGPAARDRARGIVRRRVTVASLSAATALGVVAALLVPSPGNQRLVTAGDPTPSVSETTPDVTESPTPSTSPSTPSASASASAPRIGPDSPPPPVDGGPTVELRLSKAAPTGEESVFEVHVVDPHGGLATVALSYGVRDPAHVVESGRYFYGAGTVNYGPGEVDDGRDECPDPASGPTDARLLFRHRFRIPGEYTAWVKVQTRSCDGRWVASDTLRYAVTGRLWPNGPNQPMATLAFRRSHFDNGDTKDDGPGVQIVAADDGDFRDVTVDWGDGTVESVPFKPAYAYGAYNDCEDPDEFLNDTQGVEARPDHTYAQPGSYTVTVTVTTASCDGTDRQSTTTSGTWDWPPPSASPTP